MPTELKDRINEALADSGKTKAGLARFCGVAPSSVTQWCNGRTKSLDAAPAVLASMYLGVQPLWLVSGSGPKKDFRGPVQDDDSEYFDYVSIPEYEVGDPPFGFNALGLRRVQHADIQILYSKKSLLERGVEPINCRSIKVVGSSMEPLLFDQDSALFDSAANQQIINGKVYVFKLGDTISIRRLYKKLDGTIIAHSDNREETPQDEVILKSKQHDFEILGRVIARLGTGSL